MQRRHPLLAILLLAVMPLAARAGEFTWTRPSGKHWDQDKSYRWNSPKSWSSKDGTAGPPASDKDTGNIADGTTANADADLGTDNSRPRIVVQPGGRIYVLERITMPLTLNGGMIDTNWRNTNLQSPITVTADSTLFKVNEAGDAGNNHYSGQFFNKTPVTLTIDGDARFDGDNAKTFSGTIFIRRGVLVTSQGVTSANLGTGDIILGPSAGLCYREAWLGHPMEFTVTNNIRGSGTIRAGDGASNKLVIFQGGEIRPGTQGAAGALAVRGGATFVKSAAHTPRLIIDVVGANGEAGIDYGQLAVFGALNDTLDAVDLEIVLDPKVAADAVNAAGPMIILTSTSSDLSLPGIKHFHSVTVIKNGARGTATVTYHADADKVGGWIEVSDLKLPEK